MSVSFANFFSWSKTEQPPQADGSLSEKANTAMSIQELKDKGSSETRTIDFKGEGTFNYKDGGGWIKSAVPAGSIFKVQVKDMQSEGAKPNFAFSFLKSTQFNDTLTLTQPGDYRGAPTTSKFVINGTQEQTEEILPGQNLRSKITYNNPSVKPVTLNFFLGDDNVPIPVFDGVSKDPVTDYIFNPISSEGRIQSLVLNSRIVQEVVDGEDGNKVKQKRVALTVVQQVAPTLRDRCNEVSTGTVDCTKKSFSCLTSTLAGGVKFGYNATKAGLWYSIHWGHALDDARVGAVRALGGETEKKWPLPEAKAKTSSPDGNEVTSGKKEETLVTSQPKNNSNPQSLASSITEKEADTVIVEKE